MPDREFMDCFKLVNGALQVVDEPITKADDMRASLNSAGYLRQVSSEIDDGNGAEVIVYSTGQTQRPAYFIEVNGSAHSLAYLVADDFPGLLATLRFLAPLIQLTALDQRADIVAKEAFERSQRKD